MTRKVDYIIIGQGLAGSAVAVHLMKMGKKIVVFDVTNKNSASRIAAGLFNPITGKNMVKTWFGDEIFSYLHSYYPMVESMTQRKFFYPSDIYHPFSSVKEQNEWMARSSEPALKAFIRSISVSSVKPGIKDDFGGVWINKAGYIDTKGYLEAVRQLLVEGDAFVNDHFHEEELMPEEDIVYYKDFEAKRVIFCIGTQSLENKWFKWVPIVPLKGETLSIKVEDIGNNVINRGVYIVPQGFSVYNVGSTYQVRDTSPMITDKAKEELIEKLKMVLEFDFEILDQGWGMRPTTHDRRPIIGVHPQHSNLVYFNGLGTKGVSISPYFADELTQWLEKNGTLNKQVEISRFKLVN